MPDLVMLDAAKAWIRRTDTHEDPVLDLILAQAHEMVLAVVKDRVGDTTAWEAEVDAWTEADVPAQVQAAILAQFAFLERYRGDEQAPPQKGPLSDQAMNYISRLTDPAFAS